MLARHIVDRCTAEVMGFRDGTDYNVSSYVSPTMMFYNRKKNKERGLRTVVVFTITFLFTRKTLDT